MDIYIRKQDIHIYVAYVRPNGWTEWAEIFGGHSGVKCYIFFQNFLIKFFFPWQRWALQLVCKYVLISIMQSPQLIMS